MVCFMSDSFSILILQLAIFVFRLVRVLGLGGIATECGCWRNLPHLIFLELNYHSDLQFRYKSVLL